MVIKNIKQLFDVKYLKHRFKKIFIKYIKLTLKYFVFAEKSLMIMFLFLSQSYIPTVFF